MRLAILSDVHANLEALEAVLARAREEGATAHASLGDVVGYGADPAACIDRLRALASLAAVRGNHDAMVATGEIDGGTSPRAVVAVAWTRAALDEDRRAWLAGLPLSLRPTAEVRLVHDSPSEPGSWRYVTGAREGERELAAQDTPVCFYGHTHQPLALRRGEGRVELREGAALRLAPDGVYLLNVGSVGQPRDGDPRASFGIYDDERRELTLHRVAYDVAAAQAKILAAGLPAVLASRLADGR